MAVEAFLRIVPGGAMALNQAEAEKLEDLVGKQVRCVMTQPRNIGFHRKYFAMLKVARDMCPENYNPEQFRMVAQAGAGYCEFIKSGDQLVAVPKSISFGRMDQLEFERLYNAVLNYCCERWALNNEQIDQLVDFM